MERANEVIRVLASTPRKTSPAKPSRKGPLGLGPGVNRGINVPQEILDHMKAGESYDIGPMTSWSHNYTTAKKFTKGVSSPTFFHIPYDQIKRGTNVQNMSKYKKENEFITGGKLKIVSIEKKDGVTIIHAEQE